MQNTHHTNGFGDHAKSNICAGNALVNALPSTIEWWSESLHTLPLHACANVLNNGSFKSMNTSVDLHHATATSFYLYVFVRQTISIVKLSRLSWGFGASLSQFVYFDDKTRPTGQPKAI